MQQIVAENLRSLMQYHKQHTPTAAARYARVSQQQFDRMLKGQRVRIDTLEHVARRYGLEPYQLLIPGLDPSNPQALLILTPADRRLFNALEEARRGDKPAPGTH